VHIFIVYPTRISHHSRIIIFYLATPMDSKIAPTSGPSELDAFVVTLANYPHISSFRKWKP